MFEQLKHWEMLDEKRRTYTWCTKPLINLVLMHEAAGASHPVTIEYRELFNAIYEKLGEISEEGRRVIAASLAATAALDTPWCKFSNEKQTITLAIHEMPYLDIELPEGWAFKALNQDLTSPCQLSLRDVKHSEGVLIGNKATGQWKFVAEEQVLDKWCSIPVASMGDHTDIQQWVDHLKRKPWFKLREFESAVNALIFK